MPFNRFTSVYAIDDSGELFSPLDLDGNRIRVQRPNNQWATLGAVKLSKSVVHAFVHDWVQLQSQIQRELELPYLPAIHMRLMWGKDPKRRPLCYKGKGTCKTENPYRRASADTTLKWVKEALSILKQYKKARALEIKPLAVDVFAFAENIEEWIVEEMNFVLRHVGKRTAMPFFKVLHNPYLGALSDLLAKIRISEKYGRTAIVVDNTTDVVGFDIDDRLIEGEVEHPSNMTFIGRVEELGFDANQFPLLQASDVVAFFARRIYEGDPFSRDLAHSYLGLVPPRVKRHLRSAWSRRKIKDYKIKDYNLKLLTSLIIRYQHAHAISNNTPQAKKLYALIASPEEFAQRVRAIMSEKKPIATYQISVLKTPLDGRKPAVCTYYSKKR